HLFAHLGLVLVICGGLPPGLFRRAAAAAPRVVDAAAAGCLVLLVLGQCPRAGGLPFEPQQFADLRRIEAVDRRCREHRIDAPTPGRALPPFEVYGMFGRELNGVPLSGWDLLRGSDDPEPRTVEEARRLLEGGPAD